MEACLGARWSLSRVKDDGNTDGIAAFWMRKDHERVEHVWVPCISPCKRIGIDL